MFDKRDRPLPRRDLILIPGIFALTCLVLLCGSELAVRLLFPQQREDACIVLDHRGNHYRPDCHSRMKAFEGAWIRNDFNDCGYRSAHLCSAAPTDDVRIGVLGTSVANGRWVSYDQTFAGRMEHDLSAACHRPVGVQNAALPFATEQFPTGPMALWHFTTDRVQGLLRLNPAVIVLVMNSFDLESYHGMPDGAPIPDHPAPAAPPVHVDFPANVVDGASALVRKAMVTSRALLLIRHFANSNEGYFISDYLNRGDITNYLRLPFTDSWQLRLRIADRTIGSISAQARAAHVPLLVAFMPQRAQADLSSGRANVPTARPYALGEALAAIAKAHDAYFLDVTDITRSLPDTADLYFPVDGHPNPAGHKVLADAIERTLEQDVPSFASCRQAPLAGNAPPGNSPPHVTDPQRLAGSGQP